MSRPVYDDLGPDQPCWFRFLDWLERLSGRRWPWGMVWLGKGPFRGCAFHFASGALTGFAVTISLPRMLPGFVRDYQIQSLRTREGRRESDLHLMVPLFPPGRPDVYRTMRMRGRSA